MREWINLVEAYAIINNEHVGLEDPSVVEMKQFLRKDCKKGIARASLLYNVLSVWDAFDATHQQVVGDNPYAKVYVIALKQETIMEESDWCAGTIYRNPQGLFVLGTITSEDPIAERLFGKLEKVGEIE